LLLGLIVAGLTCAGCTAKTETRAVEEAFVARDSVQLLEQLGPHGTPAATLPIGTRVEIVGRRRSFVRVRTAGPAEGWVKDSELISTEVRDLMEQARRQTQADPPQGEVRALRALNIHLEPYRWSPAIYQLREEEPATSLRHRLVERIPEKTPPGQPVETAGTDDWYLVRLADGRAGWVLASGVYSGIPVEVAQYAEGMRIVSYFPLGTVEDAALGEKKTTWLWTQISQGRHAHDFDVIRVFLWSRSRHAYQTVKIERGLRGYLPVLVEPEVQTRQGAGSGFSITVEKKGELFRRNYVLAQNRVLLVTEEPAPPLPPPIQLQKEMAPPLPPPTLMERLLSKWRESTLGEL
jgi:SH3-like domain-containing protein